MGVGGWQFDGTTRPPFAHTPKAGQRSVWDFPRPPRIDPVELPVTVKHDQGALARSERAVQVCETASPPTVYLPADDCAMHQLVVVPGQSLCEWKGRAEYLALAAADGTPIAWRYPEPKPAFAPLQGWLCFYPGRVSCWIGAERVEPQPGAFYGGWITSDLVGPFKGEPGSEGW